MAKVEIAQEFNCSVRRTAGWSCWRIFAFALFLISLSSASFSQNSKATESQVKAAYVYNFGKFITWPPDQTAKPDTFGICIFGKDPFGPVLDQTVNGELIDGRKVVVVRTSKLQDIQVCRILFVSSSELNHLPVIVNEAQRMHVLAVSDIPNFVERGGTIGLVNQGDRIRFEVNRTRAADSHLELSSELLKVAVKVIGGTSDKK